MCAVYRKELDDLLDELPRDNVRALLEVMRKLGKQAEIRRWSSAVGSLSDGDADEMRQAVAEGCERIDAGSW